MIPAGQALARAMQRDRRCRFGRRPIGLREHIRGSKQAGPCGRVKATRTCARQTSSISMRDSAMVLVPERRRNLRSSLRPSPPHHTGQSPSPARTTLGRFPHCSIVRTGIPASAATMATAHVASLPYRSSQAFAAIAQALRGRRLQGIVPGLRHSPAGVSQGFVASRAAFGRREMVSIYDKRKGRARGLILLDAQCRLGNNRRNGHLQLVTRWPLGSTIRLVRFRAAAG